MRFITKISLQTIIEYLAITIGAFIMAIGIGVFLVDAKVVPGGVSGLSMAIYYILGERIPVGIIMWVLNVPLFIWGLKELGKSFGIRTFWGFTFNSIFIDLLRGEFIKSLQWNKAEFVIYLMRTDFFFFILLGALLLGIGLGIIFKFKGTTAGSDIIAAIAQKKWHIKPGITIMVTDFFVISIAGIVIHYKQLSYDKPALVLVLYAFLLLFVSSWLIDMVISGFDYAKAAIIVSDKHEKVADKILYELYRGATAIYSKGLYSGQEREIILTVVSRREIHRLKDMVKEVDPDAFVVIYNVYEVIGKGFIERGEFNLEKIKEERKVRTRRS